MKTSPTVLLASCLQIVAYCAHGLSLDQGGSSRRDFLSTNLATAAGVAATWATPLAPAALADEASASSLAGQIELPPLGLGAWAWGDSLFWGYDKKNDADLREVFDYALSQSKYPTTLLDTAEIYGLGRSESLIGEFSKNYPADKLQVASKFAALPWRTKPQDVVKACEASVQRLGGRPIDLYQIHFPGAWANAEYWDGIAMAFDKGLVKAVGVSNYGVDATRACYEALAKRGIQLATNQIQMSLLYRHPLENGLKQACDDLGIKILSYSPLALGMLTGKYTLEAPPQGPRKLIFEKLKTTPDYDNLLATMKEVASKHDGATPAQVALNWARAKGTYPIPGARTLNQVKQNYASLEWSLTSDEVITLDSAACKVDTFNKPSDNPFPAKDKDTGLHMYDS